MVRDVLKIVLWTLSIIVCVLGVFLLKTGSSQKKAFEQARKPIAFIEANPSDIGSYSIEFNTEHSLPNKLVLGLLANNQTKLQKAQIQRAIKTFEGGCSITAYDDNKQLIFSSSVDKELKTPLRDGFVALLPMSLPSPGKYVIKLDVIKGIDNSEGLFQNKFVVYYGFCGLEMFTTQMLNCVGYISIIIGVLVMIVLLGRVRYNRSRDKENIATENQASHQDDSKD